MTQTQRITVRLSEVRQKLNDLLGVEERSDEQNTELETLTAEAQKLEPELRAAIAAEGDPNETRTATEPEDAETRERREIRSRSTLGGFISGAIDGKLDGAEAELSAAYGCPPGQMPIAMLMREPEVRTEVRAVTPGVVAPGLTDTITPVLFQRTAAASLGVTFATVPSGQANYPVMTGAPSADVKAKGATAPETAGAFRLDTRTPRRVTGSFKVAVEDLAQLPGMEESLRTVMDDVMGAKVDDQVFNGNNTAPNLDGLFRQAADVTAATAVETFETGVERYADLVDGTYADSFRDLRAVIGPKTFAKYASTFRGSQGDRSLYGYLMEMLGGLRVSARMPAVSGMAQKGLVAKTRGSQPHGPASPCGRTSR